MALPIEAPALQEPIPEIPSRIDPRKRLSYDRWSITIVYGGNISNAISLPDLPNGQRRDYRGTWQSVFSRLMGHARIVIEKNTPQRGYQVFDCGLVGLEPQLGGRAYTPTRSDGRIKVFNDIDITLASINGSMGTMIKSAERVQQVLDYILEKRDACRDYMEQRLSGRNVASPLILDMIHPNPENNEQNCLIFTFEAAKAGGINLYSLYKRAPLIPRRDIDLIPNLVDNAIEEKYELDEDLKQYIAAYQDGSYRRERAINKTIFKMMAVVEEGPFAAAHYRRMQKEQGLDGGDWNEEVMLEARRQRNESCLETSVDATTTVALVVPSFFVMLPAIVTQLTYNHFSSKNRRKRAAVKFFEEEEG